MYISLTQIAQSLNELENLHPFFGITFLTCKAGGLPVGKAVEFHIDAEERIFLEKYYRPDRASLYFYRVFRPSDKQKRWLSAKYASAGSQATRTKRGFVDAFIHTRGTAIWGWRENYVERLQGMLRKRKRVPALHLAVWLFRESEWSAGATARDLVERFRDEFKMTDREVETLYDLEVPSETDTSKWFSETIVTWRDLKRVIGPPPDAAPEEGGTLSFLKLTAIGPVSSAELTLAERLNLVTGDNGLGKTFLLECAWWALTGQWAGLPATPTPGAKIGEPKITFEITAESARPDRLTLGFNWQSLSWTAPKRRPTIPGLLVYGRVDGSFAVWDPVRELITSAPGLPQMMGRSALVISKEQVWDGYEEQVAGRARAHINGLIRDWSTWQSNPDRHPFDVFKRVLKRLSPRDLGTLEPGAPTRLPGDTREIPTIKHAYGEAPVPYAAAGVRRILALSYLIVWAWEEHRVQSELIRRKPQRRMVIMIDEIEAHLHPKWQRTILPAVLGLGDELSSDLRIQFLVATHSPLVMVSLEGVFDEESDSLFHLAMPRSEGTPQVVVNEVDFLKHGRVDAWLTSDLFDLEQPRSQEAEIAIRRAKSLQLTESPDVGEIREINETLIRLLPSDDDFWPRWKYFAERHGVSL